MTPDLQEAESRKYSDACFILLRLRSGRTALMDNQRRIVAIDDLEFLAKRRELTTYIEPRPRPQPVVVPSLDLDMELDL